MNLGRKKPMALIIGFALMAAVGGYGCGDSSNSGDACSPCKSNSDCDNGLACFSFNDGATRCARNVGDTCTTLLFVAPSSQNSPFDNLLEALEKVDQ